MKKLYYISYVVILSVFAISIVSANTTNFNARISDGSSYSTGTSFTDGPFTSNSGTIFDFETIIMSTSGSGSYDYNVNLPSGFSHTGTDSINAYGLGCSAPSIVYETNRFSFFIPDGNCVYEVYSSYKADTTGNVQASLLESSGSSISILSSINFQLVGTNSIIKAESLDLNYNGYTDAYKITLSKAGLSSDFSQLKVGSSNFSSVVQSGSTSVFVASFEDSKYTSSDLPEITGTFYGTSMASVDIIEVDSSLPELMKINGLATKDSSGNILTPQINPNSNGDVVLEFSEAMNTTNTLAAVKINGGSFGFSGQFDSTRRFLTIHPNSPFVASSTYSLTIYGTASDLSGNYLPQSISNLYIGAPDTQAPVGNKIASGTGILIDDGQDSTENQYVNLNLSATDDMLVKEMCIKNTSNADCTSSWIPYSTKYLNWQLASATVGDKQVFVRFRDASGNMSSEYSDIISYITRNGTDDFGVISFNSPDSLYIKSQTFSASGNCSYTTYTGATVSASMIWETLDSLGATHSGSVSCSSNTWNVQFAGLSEGNNRLKIYYGSNVSISGSIVLVSDTLSPSISVSPQAGQYHSKQSIAFSGNEVTDIYYATGGVSPTENSSKYTSPFFINSSTELRYLAYDRAGNSSSGSALYSFTCDPNITSNGTYSTYPLCTLISCNSGYHASGNSCVVDTPSSGGGGGGGGGGSVTPDSCPAGDTSGSSYDGRCIPWNVSNTSSGSGDSSGSGVLDQTGSTGVISIPEDISYQPISEIKDLNITNIDSTFFKNVLEALEYLSGSVTSMQAKNLAISNYEKLRFYNAGYFIKYDLDFAKAYNRALNAYVLFTINMDAYYKGDISAGRKSDIAISYKMLLDGIESIYLESQKQVVWFDDIEDSFAKDDIIEFALKGILKGNGSGSFLPNNPITRAEFLGVAMKTLSIGVSEDIVDSEFRDIPSGSWIVKYAEKAKEFGILGQVKNGNKIFRPSDPISRAEALAMLFRLSGLESPDTVVTEFSDIPEDGIWMIKYIEAARNMQIASGQIIEGELRFRPLDPISRAESVRIIKNTLYKLNQK